MKNRVWAFQIASMLGLFALGCSDDSATPSEPEDEIKLADPSGVHEGRSYGEWAGQWWNWLYSSPASTNPALDTTGEFANENQTLDVFMLAGSFGSIESRSFTIPADMPVFFPITTTQADNCGVPVDMQLTDEELQAYANDSVAAVTELNLEIDSETFASSPDDFSAYLVAATEMSYVVPADDSLYDLQGSDFEGECSPSFTAGYFVMIEGLPAGEHALHFSALTPGATPAEDFAIDVTDSITAE
jgi:hypothetical protein